MEPCVAINDLVREESDVLYASGKPDHHSKRKNYDKFHDSLELSSSKVASKLKERNSKGAARLAYAVNVWQIIHWRLWRP